MPAFKRLIHPFVGTIYKTHGLRNSRVMIVGESSYDKKARQEGYDAANQTINVGTDAIGYEEGRGYWNRSRFYTRIVRMFGYDPRSYAHRREFWNSVVYYNYLQVVLTEAREYPPANSWGDAKDAFLETLEEHRPETVVAFSKRMWPHLPKNSESPLLNDLGVDCRTGELELSGGHQVRLISFLHPTSFGFRWEPVSKILNSFIQKTPG